MLENTPTNTPNEYRPKRQFIFRRKLAYSPKRRPGRAGISAAVSHGAYSRAALPQSSRYRQSEEMSESLPVIVSAQVVPDPTATAMLVEGAAFDQCPEMLLECVPAGPGQLDSLADRDATMLAREFDYL